jgi:hypothetical protein
LPGVFLDNVSLQEYELADFIGCADKAPYSCNIKGSFAWCHCVYVAVTSVESPKEMWERRWLSGNKQYTWEEIERRINHLFFCHSPIYDQNKKFVKSSCYEVNTDAITSECPTYSPEELDPEFIDYRL